MVKGPLFYEMIVFFLFCSGALAWFLFWRNEKVAGVTQRTADLVNYENSLRLFSEGPESQMAQDACFIFGHLYYSHYLPNFDSPNDLDLYNSLIENLDPVLLRESWIIADMQQILEEKYQNSDSIAA